MSLVPALQRSGGQRGVPMVEVLEHRGMSADPLREPVEVAVVGRVGDAVEDLVVTADQPLGHCVVVMTSLPAGPGLSLDALRARPLPAERVSGGTGIAVLGARGFALL